MTRGADLVRMRRHEATAGLRVIETHPGGGQSDCWTVIQPTPTGYGSAIHFNVGSAARSSQSTCSGSTTGPVAVCGALSTRYSSRSARVRSKGLPPGSVDTSHETFRLLCRWLWSRGWVGGAGAVRRDAGSVALRMTCSKRDRR